MKLAVFGLGYVGSVSAACFCKLGHEVIGIDVNPVKVQMINDGKSPVIEPGLTDLISKFVQKGRLKATTNIEEAIVFADVSLVCVGTPSLANGELNVEHVLSVFRQIGEHLKKTKKYHVVALRSTMLPDAYLEQVIPELIKAAEVELGEKFGVCAFPEFLREGTAIKDFFDPPKIVIGEIDKKSGDLLEELNRGIEAPLFRCELQTACMVKYVDNSFHALKVDFANEIARICKPMAIDSYKVMEIFCSDEKLNISSAYLKPGFAFGGSCLPKDVRALTHKAKHLDVEVPILSNLLRSNEIHYQQLVDTLVDLNKKKLGFLGLSFKEDTDDLRESPIVQVIESMIGKGFSVSIFDENVKLASLIGANKAYIENEIPHISKLIRDSVETVVSESDVVIISQKHPKFSQVTETLTNGEIVIDLVKAIQNPSPLSSQYKRFC